MIGSGPFSRISNAEAEEEKRKIASSETANGR
jgi:hypothetical protein